jgi:hypothetical protein
MGVSTKLSEAGERTEDTVGKHPTPLGPVLPPAEPPGRSGRPREPGLPPAGSD